MPALGILRVVDRLDVFDLTFRVVLDHHLQRAQHRERALRAAVEILADGVLEQRDVDDVLFLRDADARAEVADRLRRVAAATDARRSSASADRPSRTRASARPAPAACACSSRCSSDSAARTRSAAVVSGTPSVAPQVVHHPVVQRPMILELQRAERVRDAFDRVRDRMRVVVGRIDAPGVAGAVMRRVSDAVQRRVPHVDVRRRHVDLRAQHVRAVGKLAARMRRNRSRFSSTDRSRYGLLRPGSVSVPRYSRISSAVRLST